MSVRANLAEGCGRSTPKDFAHFVEIALSSLNELQDQLIPARDERMIMERVYGELQAEADLLRRMLIALLRTLQRAIAGKTTRVSSGKVEGECDAVTRFQNLANQPPALSSFI
jgi:hypothetical protein